MQDYAKKELRSITGAPFMQYKIYLEDLSNIVEMCTNKCINNYNNAELGALEKLCLEKCYFKTLEMNQYVSDEIPNIMNREDYKVPKEYTFE
jgi:hypothetical protein